MQANTKAKSHFDFLCIAFVIVAVLCLSASLPASYQMVRTAHDEWTSGALLVVVELMAFFALLAVLWVPSWERELRRIGYTLIVATSLGNFAAGWDYLWRPDSDLAGFWRGLRDFEMWGFHPFAALMVGVLAAAVPYGMKFFIELAIRRYRENELEHTPEAVARRALEPIMVHLEATRQLEGRLESLRSSAGKTTMLLEDTPRKTWNFSNPLNEAGLNRNDVEREWEAVQKENDVKQPAQATTKAWNLDDLLAGAGMTREEVLDKLNRYGVTDAGAAFRGLRMLGRLPQGMSEADFTPLYDELVARPF